MLELNVTPDGRTPDSDKVGAGEPVAATVNDPAVPTAKFVLLAERIAEGDGSAGATPDCPPPPQPVRIDPKRPTVNRPPRSRQQERARRVCGRHVSRRTRKLPQITASEPVKHFITRWLCRNIFSADAPDRCGLSRRSLEANGHRGNELIASSRKACHYSIGSLHLALD